MSKLDFLDVYHFFMIVTFPIFLTALLVTWIHYHKRSSFKNTFESCWNAPKYL